MPSVDRRNILLVEDERIVALNEKRALEKAGYNVSVASSGEAAIEEVRTHNSIALVLMDIDLGPGIDGTEAAEGILKLRNLPVIFLTGHAEDEYVERAQRITGFGYVLKSSDSFALLQAMRMAFDLFAAQQRLRESEEKYRAAFMTTPEAVNINGLDGRYVDINQGFTDLTGYTRDDVIGKLSSEIEIWAVSEDRERLVEGLRSTGLVDGLESVFRCKDGITKTAVMAARIIAINGTPHILSITRDISEQKRREAQLKASEDRFRLAVDGSRDGLWDWDLLTNEAYFSEQFAKMLGYDRSELPPTGAAWLDLLHPNEKDQALQRLQEYLGGDAPYYESTFRMRAKDGSYRWITGRGKAEYDGTGRALRLVGFNRDVTGEVERTAEIQRLLEEKDALLAEINHRVKNNLAMVSALVGFKEASLGDGIDLSDISRQIDAIRLVYDKLNQSGEATEVALSEYVEELVQPLTQLGTEQTIRFVNKIPSIDVPSRTAVTLGIIINELVTNAVKHGFCPDVEATLIVSLDPERENGLAELTVSNSGRPFPEDVDLERGSTLGLSLVNAMVYQLNGSLNLERSPQTTITIEFPLTNLWSAGAESGVRNQ